MPVISNEVKGSIKLKYSEGLGPDGKEKFRYIQKIKIKNNTTRWFA